MTEPIHDRNEQPDAETPLPDELSAPQDGLAVPPPVPQKKPGFLRRLFTTRKQQQAVAVQNGYLEMVDLIRAIRSHLDRQEAVQTRVLSMLEKVPGAMDRQHEVMTLFKQQLESNIVNDQRLTDSMGRLSGTLDAMNESQKASSRTVTDLITRSRESEQLLREVMRRAERRMTLLIAFFVLLVIGTVGYLVHWQHQAIRSPAPAAEPPAADVAVAEVIVPPAEPAPAAVAEVVAEPEPTEEQPADAEPVALEPAAAAEDVPEVAAPPPAEPEAEPAVAPPPTQEEKPKAKARDRRRRTKAEPTPEPIVNPEPVVEAAPEPAPQPAAATDPEPKAAPEPVAEIQPESPAEEKPEIDPEEQKLYQLKAAIGGAVLDAFTPSQAPVSLP
jgi:hypothetical protein